MRTIKFRGKSCNTGEWFYGNLYITDSFGSTYIHKSMDSFLEVYSETIGQFTGLKDKNGKEIYEGDILKWKADNLLYAVTFNWGMFYASVEVCNQDIYGGFPLHALAEVNGKDVEIVGNIYDNPELIQKLNNKLNYKI